MPTTRIAIAGCGSVSGPYLTDLSASAFVDVVSVCDTVPERAAARALEFGVPHHFGGIDQMLAGPDFDLLVNTTAMPAHFEVNRAVLEAGRHVWSEKPLAGTYAQGLELADLARRQGARIWAAPTVVTSPAFQRVAEIVGSGDIGTVYAARAWYGHTGPGWGPWFYRKGGGAMFDLAVYNLTTLTGLLGPAVAVSAMTGTAIPERQVDGQTIRAEADDNLAVLMDHGACVFSCVQSGFVYGRHPEERTIELIGTRGSVSMLGWDWLPNGVEVCREDGSSEVFLPGPQGYTWEQGASYLARCLVEGREPQMTIEHALHVLEVMQAAHESAASGRCIPIESRLAWPVFGAAPRSTDRADRPDALDPDTHKR